MCRHGSRTSAASPHTHPVFLYYTPQVLAHLIPYLLDPHNYRRPAISGPWLNALTDAWLAHAAAQGNRSERVHELHKKYGKFVRIAPNHISIADPDALQASLAFALSRVVLTMV